jgi:hypothetical protein
MCALNLKYSEVILSHIELFQIIGLLFGLKEEEEKVFLKG